MRIITTLLFQLVLASFIYSQNPTQKIYIDDVCCSKEFQNNDSKPHKLILDSILGAGNWVDKEFKTTTPNQIFNSNTRFIWLNAIGNNSGSGIYFFKSNETQILNWVQNGGRLFVEVDYLSGQKLWTVGAGYDPLTFNVNSSLLQHPILSSPNTISNQSNFYSSFALSGFKGSNVFSQPNGSQSNLSELRYGDGSIVFTTIDVFQSISVPFFSLYQNILTYLTSPLNTWYRDLDGDGFGNGNNLTLSTNQPSGFVNNNRDCDDNNVSIHPNATEVCGNGIDENCTGKADEGSFMDNDFDGLKNCEDCAPNDATLPKLYYVDEDGDGFGSNVMKLWSCTDTLGYVTNSLDCKDNDPNINPNSVEIVDGKDNDCDYRYDEGFEDRDSDGLADVLDCAPLNPYLPIIYYEDLDGDGYGNYNKFVRLCALPSGYSADGSDCDDTDPNKFPNADTDGDGVYNCEDCAPLDPNVFQKHYYLDQDGDGYGQPYSNVYTCNPPAGYFDIPNTDCNDNDPTIYPGAPEVCANNKDNNCDGRIGSGPDSDLDGYADCLDCAVWNPVFPRHIYRDLDGDGYGRGSTIFTCSLLQGYAMNNQDCDDDDPSVHPNGNEICNGKDDDCNYYIDDYATDTDRDGVPDCTDCSPNDPYFPAQAYFDFDGDGYGSIFAGSYCTLLPGIVFLPYDCDDTDPTKSNDDIDGDGFTSCNGDLNDMDPNLVPSSWFIDLDGDGYGTTNGHYYFGYQRAGYVDNYLDCNDSDPLIHPGSVEICNGKDDNCDGTNDNLTNPVDSDGDGISDCEDCAPNDSYLPRLFYIDLDGDGFGNQYMQYFGCDTAIIHVISGGDCDDQDALINPSASEICNDNKDNNCNYSTDETTNNEDLDNDGFLSCSDCDDNNPNLPMRFYNDYDGDGYGSSYAYIYGCTARSGYVTNNIDCDDFDATRYDGVTDADGDGYTVCSDCDDNDPLVNRTWYQDLDYDGYGNNLMNYWGCNPPTGYVSISGDCDDNDPAIHPTATEICGNGKDDDCDGNVYNQNLGLVDTDGDSYPDCDDCAPNDPTLPTYFYFDFDGDGSFGYYASYFGCSPPSGYINSQLSDCDDFNSYLNSADVDGDGFTTCNNDCDDNDPSITTVFWFKDEDGDGYGSYQIYSCTQIEGFIAVGGDCDDRNPNINPGTAEICNNSIDDNCNYQTDESPDGVDTDGDGMLDCSDCNINDPLLPGYFYRDLDGDGYGRYTEYYGCTPPEGLVFTSGDCDDTDPNINPMSLEICNNSIDDNCNYQIDESPDGIDSDGDGVPNCSDCAINDPTLPRYFYNDYDGDGFGTYSYSYGCDQSVGTAIISGDCDDSNPNVNPNGIELCNNNFDDNCNGQVDESPDGVDTDGDGVPNCSDCAINDPLFPSHFYYDSDGDGYGYGSSPYSYYYGCNPPAGLVRLNGDCDDFNGNINPGAPEICNNNIDENCNYYADDTAGNIDTDGDDIQDCSDCAANDKSLPAHFYMDLDGDGFGNAFSNNDHYYGCTPPLGMVRLNGDCNDSNPNVNPISPEICNNGINDNCDDQTDESSDGIDSDGDGIPDCSDCAVNNPSLPRTYFQDNDGDGYGKSGYYFGCNPPQGMVTLFGDCDDNNANVNPASPEICNNGVDDNCDYYIDESSDGLDTDGDGTPNCSDCAIDDPSLPRNFSFDYDGDGFGPFAFYFGCNPPEGMVGLLGDCNDNNPNIHPNSLEICNNGIDDNCNNLIDDSPNATDADNDGISDCADCALNNPNWPKKLFYDSDQDGFGNYLAYTTCDSIFYNTYLSYWYLSDKDGDCYDNNSQIHPNSTEICNGLDDDCDNLIDENLNCPAIQVFGNNISIQNGTYDVLQTNNTNFGELGIHEKTHRIFQVHNVGSDTLFIDTVYIIGYNSPFYPSINLNNDYILPGQKKSLKISVASNVINYSSYGRVVIVPRNQGEFRFSVRTFFHYGRAQITGNNVGIVNLSTTTSVANNTDFGNLNLGSSVVKTFKMKNTSLGTLLMMNVPRVKIMGSSAFTVDHFAINSLKAGASSTFKLKFAPQTPGEHEAIIEIPMNNFQGFFKFKVKGSTNTTGTTNSEIRNRLEEDRLVSNNLSLYPNPAKDQIHVTLSNENIDEASLRILDVNGKIVSESKILNFATTPISISDLPSGVYTILCPELPDIEAVRFIKVE